MQQAATSQLHMLRLLDVQAGRVTSAVVLGFGTGSGGALIGLLL